MKHMNILAKIALITIIPSSIIPLISSCNIGEIEPVDPVIVTPKVTFNPNGGKIGDSEETKYIYVELNSTFDQIGSPTPSREGYKFSGWLNPAGELMVDQPIVEDIELTASWEKLMPEIGDKVLCTTADDNQWIADMASLCSEDSQIVLTPREGGQEQKVNRDSFNATSLLIGEDISEIPDFFMYNCSSFNGTIIFSNNDPQLRDIGESFMSGCSKFNSKLVLPTSVRTIYSGFLFDCSLFDSELDLSETRAIGQDFMGMCTSFSQKLIISDKIEALGSAFMWECRSFTQLEVNCRSYALTSDDTSTLIVTTKDCPAYNGVYVSGTCKNIFVGQFGPISSDGKYRTLLEVS